MANTQSTHEAILEGLERAANLGLTKPDDIAFAIAAALDAAGLKVIRDGKRSNFDNQKPHR